MLADDPAECIEYEGVTKEDLIVSVGRIVGVLSLTDTFEIPRFSNGLAKPVLVKMPVGDDSGVEIPLRSVNAEDNAGGIIKLDEPIRGAAPTSAADAPSCVLSLTTVTADDDSLQSGFEEDTFRSYLGGGRASTAVRICSRFAVDNRLS